MVLYGARGAAFVSGFEVIALRLHVARFLSGCFPTRQPIQAARLDFARCSCRSHPEYKVLIYLMGLLLSLSDFFFKVLEVPSR